MSRVEIQGTRTKGNVIQCTVQMKYPDYQSAEILNVNWDLSTVASTSSTLALYTLLPAFGHNPVWEA